MGTAYSARQSSYTQGDTINADDSNDEFDAILAAFGTSGHSHDGTAGEGGAIAKLLSNTLTFGAATSGTDITITFDGESNDGVLAWMEDEDYFKFSDDILINSTEKIMFGDSTSFIHQSSDGVLTIDGEATIDLNASTAVLVSNDLKLNSDAAVLGFGADNDVTLTHVADTGLLLNSTMAIQFNDASQYINAPSATVLDINATDEVEVNATLMDVNANLDVSGTYTGGGLMTTGGNIVIPDGGNIGSASDTDAISISSNGVVTMNQIPVFSAGINVSGGTIAGTLSTAAQGNVTSLGTLTSLTVDNIIINGTTIGHTSDTDAMTISSGGVVTFSQTPVFSGDLTIGDDVYLDSDATVIHFGDDGDVTLTHVADTGLLLNSTRQLQFGDSGTYIHQSADGVLDLVSDTEIEINATTIDINGAVDVSGAYTGGGLMTTGGNIVIPDAGNIGSASDTDAIAISSGGVVTMNQIPVFSAGINVSGGTIAGTLATAAQGNVTSLGTLTTLTVDNIIINGTTIGHTSDTDAMTISSGGVVTFSQTPVFSSDLTLGDDLYLDSDGAVIHLGDDGDVTLTHVADTGLLLNSTRQLQFGDSGTYIHQSADGVLDLVSDTEIEINATTIDVNGNLDVSGTGKFTGNYLQVGDNNAAGGDYDAVLYLLGDSSSGFKIGVNAANTLLTIDREYNGWQSGMMKLLRDGSEIELNATLVDVNANLDVSGTIAGTLSTAAQGNITSLGTLTSLTVDNIIINGNTIGHTSDTDAITIASDGKVTLNQQFKVNGDVLADFGGNVHLTHDGAILHFGANSEITLTHVHDTGIQLPDNQKMLFGDNNDLQIYHNESHSFIDDAGTGDLYIRGDNSLYISNAAGTETKASFTSDGAVNLYYNNTAVAMTNGTAWTPSSADGSSLGNSSLEWSDLFLADSSTIQFGNDQDVILTHVPDSGLRLFDGVKFMFGDANDLQIYHVDGGNSWIRDTATAGNFIIEAVNGIDFRDYNTGELMTRMTGDGAVTLYHNNEAKLATSAVGTTITGTLIATTDTDTSNSGSVTLDFGANQNFVLTLTGNVTLANPSTEQVGQAGVIVAIQDGTGSRTLSLGSDYESVGGSGITLSTAANAVDIIPYFVKASGSIQLGAPQLAFS